MVHIVVYRNSLSKATVIKGAYTSEEDAKQKKLIEEARGQNSGQNTVNITHQPNAEYVVYTYRSKTDEKRIREYCSSKSEADSVVSSLSLSNDEQAGIKELDINSNIPDYDAVEYRLFVREQALGAEFEDDVPNPTKWVTDFERIKEGIEKVQSVSDWSGKDTFVIHIRYTGRSGPEAEATIGYSNPVPEHPNDFNWGTVSYSV